MVTLSGQMTGVVCHGNTIWSDTAVNEALEKVLDKLRTKFGQLLFQDVAPGCKQPLPDNKHDYSLFVMVLYLINEGHVQWEPRSLWSICYTSSLEY